jgi:hypothetical protein
MEKEQISEIIPKRSGQTSLMKLDELILENKKNQGTESRESMERDSNSSGSIDSLHVNIPDTGDEEIEKKKNCLERIKRESITIFSEMQIELLNYKIKYKYLNCTSNIKNSFHQSISE